MADIKWIKLATCMPDDEKIKLIDAMPERDTIHYIWIRILLLGGKVNANGEVFLSEGKPLTAKALAILFSRPLEAIKLALKVLSRFGMIEIAPDKVIRIVNWNKYQNIEGMERVREQNRKRAENHREKKRLEDKASKGNEEETYEDEVLKDNKDMDDNRDLDKNTDLPQNTTSDDNESLENIKAASTNTVIGDKTNSTANGISGNTTIEDANNQCNVGRNINNVTQNESNVTVTLQNKNKKEIENKNKKEKKDIEKDKNTEENINLKAMELMQYHEKITGKPGGRDFVALAAAIDIYGEKWVKMAMEVGFERNCPDIKYAIGVLKNWKRDGGPQEQKEVKKNGFRSLGKNMSADKNEFAGFKPKEPRKLTEAERKKIEATLI